jgi:hypothetical protein
MWAWRWRRSGTSGTRRRACEVSEALWLWAGPPWGVASQRVGVWECGCGCAVRFTSAGSGKTATAVKASGYLFNLLRHAKTGKWYAQIWLRGVKAKTRLHKLAWQAAADMEWQLARWCAHTDQPRSRYVGNAARLVELGRADAAGVLTESVTVVPWDLPRWDGGGGEAAPAGERLCCARGEACAVARLASLTSTHCAAASAASSDSSSDSEEEEEEVGDSDSDSESEEEEAAAGGGGRHSASRAPAAPARPAPPAAARPAAGGAGAGRRAPALPPPAAAAAAPAPPRRRRLSRFAMSLRGLLPPVSDEVLAAAVWRLYGVSAFEPTARSGGGGVGRKRRRSDVAGGAGEEREGAAGGGGGGRRRVGS